MSRKMAVLVLVLVLAFLAAAAGAWCEDALYVKMPVRGLHYEPSQQEIFSYEGVVHLYWTTEAATGGSAAWTVICALEASGDALFCSRGVSLRGYSTETVAAARGDAVPLEITFWASCIGDVRWFKGRMRVYVTIPM